MWAAFFTLTYASHIMLCVSVWLEHCQNSRIHSNMATHKSYWMHIILLFISEILMDNFITQIHCQCLHLIQSFPLELIVIIGKIKSHQNRSKYFEMSILEGGETSWKCCHPNVCATQTHGRTVYIDIIPSCRLSSGLFSFVITFINIQSPFLSVTSGFETQKPIASQSIQSIKVNLTIVSAGLQSNQQSIEFSKTFIHSTLTI